jgi:hypothetical protein
LRILFINKSNQFLEFSSFLVYSADSAGAKPTSCIRGLKFPAATSHFTTSPLHHLTTSPLHHFTTSPLHHFTTSPLHHFTISPLHHFTTSPFHHSQLHDFVL